MKFDKPSVDLDLAVAKAAGMHTFTATTPEWRTQLLHKGTQCVLFISNPVECRHYEGMKYVGDWCPSRDMTDAWEAAEKIGLFDPDGFAANLCQVDTPKGKQWCIDWPGTDVGFEVQAATGPLAICAAIIGTQKGKPNDRRAN